MKIKESLMYYSICVCVYVERTNRLAISSALVQHNFDFIFMISNIQKILTVMKLTDKFTAPVYIPVERQFVSG